MRGRGPALPHRKRNASATERSSSGIRANLSVCRAITIASSDKSSVSTAESSVACFPAWVATSGSKLSVQSCSVSHTIHISGKAPKKGEFCSTCPSVSFEAGSGSDGPLAHCPTVSLAQIESHAAGNSSSTAPPWRTSFTPNITQPISPYRCERLLSSWRRSKNAQMGWLRDATHMPKATRWHGGDWAAAASPRARAMACSTPRPRTRHDMTKLCTKSMAPYLSSFPRRQSVAPTSP
eukprot:scaffold109322_cov30-Tisochrysis_lutea.AAC.3